MSRGARRRNWNSSPHRQQPWELALPEAILQCRPLHPFSGSVQQYLKTTQRSRPTPSRRCPQCQADDPLTAHGFYSRTIIDAAFDGAIRVRRYLCEVRRRTVSLLPESHCPTSGPSPRLSPGGSWFTCFRRRRAARRRQQCRTSAVSSDYAFSGAQAAPVCVALAALTTHAPAPNFIERALGMRTHRRPSFPVRGSSPTPVGLAAVAGSGRGSSVNIRIETFQRKSVL